MRGTGKDKPYGNMQGVHVSSWAEVIRPYYVFAQSTSGDPLPHQKFDSEPDAKLRSPAKLSQKELSAPAEGLPDPDRFDNTDPKF